jgi:cytochrome P450
MRYDEPPAPELFTWEFATDPYPAYAWLREHAPVHRTKLPSGVEAWLVTRHGDATDYTKPVKSQTVTCPFGVAIEQKPGAGRIKRFCNPEHGRSWRRRMRLAGCL